VKVAIVQNLANSMFPLVTCLRDNGIDARLFVGYTCRDDEGNPLPEPGQDPFFITGKRYDWVHYLDFSSQARSFFYNRNELADFDIIHSCCMAPIVNQFFLGGKKFLALANGSDLRSYCLGRGLKSSLLRRAYRRAGALVYVNLDEGTVSSLKKLGLTGKARFLEYLIDLPQGDTETDQAEKVFTLFYPSALRDRVKGTSIFIEAFSRLAVERPHCKLHLIDHGEDRPLIRRLVADYGLERFVEWHGFCHPSQMSRLYRSCDVVLGYFHHGTLGVPHYPKVLLEGCYFGKAVVSSYDEPVIKDHYSNFPVLQARSAEEIFTELVSLYDDRDYCKDIGRRGASWFRDNCSASKVTWNLIGIYTELLTEERIL
jgi:glycosyltransferase involved in cell wall biosynthesis